MNDKNELDEVLNHVSNSLINIIDELSKKPLDDWDEIDFLIADKILRITKKKLNEED